MFPILNVVGPKEMESIKRLYNLRVIKQNPVVDELLYLSLL